MNAYYAIDMDRVQIEADEARAEYHRERAVHGQPDEAVTPEDRQADPLKQAARITGRGHKTRAFEPCARRHRASAG
ncbi:MAG TPA: hypothetical protein PLZ07_12410 [Syntrophales bacterium]|nr:hypothetical protein [Syntrophales bacterium]